MHMTPPSSKPTGISVRARAHPLLVVLRRHWLLTLSVAALVVALIGGLLALAYYEGFFVHGPAADTATAFLTDVRQRDYAAAYKLLAPDLRAGETEQAFASAMETIRLTDGPITSFKAREIQSDSGFTVVGFDVTRTVRGAFSVHIRLAHDKGGEWLVSGVDDV